MSSRQRQRLRLQQQQQRDISSDESEEEIVPHSVFSFAGMASSSDDDDDDDHEKEIVEGKSAAADRDVFKRDILVENALQEQDNSPLAMAENDEDELLDKLINESSCREQNIGELRKTYLSQLFALQSPAKVGNSKSAAVIMKSLDVDALISKRFGAIAAFTAQVEREATGGGARRVLAAGAQRARKWLFGQKDEWGSPIPFVRGGLGMTRNLNAGVGIKSDRGKFTIERSPGYVRSDRICQAVAASGDINRLVMFLIHVDAFHPDALLQLSALYCKLPGCMDRALDLVRRAIHAFEAAGLEAFWKDLLAGDAEASVDTAKGYSESTCLLDWHFSANVPLFVALFRYMQICGMMNYNSLAADVGRMTLCLCPADDPMNILLALDCYLARSARASVVNASTDARTLVKAYMGVQEVAVLSRPTGGHWVRLVFAAEEQTLALGIDIDSEDLKQEASQSAWARLTVAHLPSWWFSLAVVEAECEQHGKDLNAQKAFPGTGRMANDGSMAASQSPPLSELLLAEAVRRWPQFLLALLRRLDPGAAVDEMEARIKVCRQDVQRWRSKVDLKDSIAWSGESPWASVDAYDDPCQVSDRSDTLQHLATIFAERHAELYKDISRLSLLQRAVRLATATSASSGPMPLSCHSGFSNYSASYLSAHPAISKYKSASVEDFSEKFAFIPEEMNPLEPMLQDPLLLEARQRELQQQRARREYGADVGALLGVHVEEDANIGGRGALALHQLRHVMVQRGPALQQILASMNMNWEELFDEAEGSESAEGDFANLSLETLWRRFSRMHSPPANNSGNAAGNSERKVTSTQEPRVRREHILDSVRSRATDGSDYALDPNAPLMQLFLQSLLPWFQAM